MTKENERKILRHSKKIIGVVTDKEKSYQSF